MLRSGIVGTNPRCKWRGGEASIKLLIDHKKEQIMYFMRMIFSSSGNLMTMDSDQKKMCRSVHLRILRLELQVKKSGKKIFSVGEGRDHIWVRTSSVTSVRLQFPRKMIKLLIFRTKWKCFDDDSHCIDIVGLNNRPGGNGGENPLLRSKVFPPFWC